MQPKLLAGGFSMLHPAFLIVTIYTVCILLETLLKRGSKAAQLGIVGMLGDIGSLASNKILLG